MSGPVQAAALKPLPDVRPKLLEGVEPADRLCEVIIHHGQTSLAELPQGGRELDVLSGELRLAVIGGERDREGLLPTLGHAQDVVFEPRDHPLVAEHERESLRLHTFDELPIPAALEADDHEVALLGGPTLDGHQRRLLVAQLLDDLVDLVLTDRLDLGREGIRLVVTELHGWAEGQGHPVAGAGQLREADPFGRPGQLQHVELRLLAECFDDAPFVEVFASVVVDRVGNRGVLPIDAHGALEHLARHLAGPEAGDAHTALLMADRLIDGGVDPLSGNLHLEDDGAAVGGGSGDLHGRTIS